MVASSELINIFKSLHRYVLEGAESRMKFRSSLAMMDVTMSSHIVWTSSPGRTMTDCADLCFSDVDCVSYTYHSVDTFCQVMIFEYFFGFILNSQGTGGGGAPSEIIFFFHKIGCRFLEKRSNIKFVVFWTMVYQNAIYVIYPSIIRVNLSIKLKLESWQTPTYGKQSQ